MIDPEMLLDRLRYKPGWSFEWLEYMPPKPPGLRIIVRLPDSVHKVPTGARVAVYKPAKYTDYDDSPTTAVMTTESLMAHPLSDIAQFFVAPASAMANQIEFYDWVFRCIDIMDTHERKEWFKVDGLHWHDPHPEFNNPTARRF